MTTKESRLGNLARKWLDFTRKDQIRWEETTADEKTFRLVLDSGMVQIQERRPDGPFSVMQAPPVEYVLTLLNENNNLAETFKESQTGGGEGVLHNLYDAARESALRPDQLLDRIDSEITRLAEMRQRG